MRQFFTRTLSFLLLFGIVAATFYFINHFLFEKYKAVIPNTTKSVFLGDSHFQRGVNPKIIEGSLNIAQPGENYLINKLKLNYLLENSKSDSLKFVILPFSHLNISVFSDLKFLEDDGTMTYFERYSVITSLKDFDKYKISERKYTRAFIKEQILPNFEYLSYLGKKPKKDKIFQVPFIGKYNPYTGKYIEDLEYRIQEHFGDSSRAKEIGTISISEINEINAICKKNNLQIILLKTPITKEYLDLVPVFIKEKRNELEKDCEKNGIVIFDFEQYFSDRKYFRDSDHINALGADSLSIIINSQLNKK